MFVINKFKMFVRSCYDYMIKLAAHPNAMIYLFVISFIESSFFPIPPDVMMIPMILANVKNAWKIGTITVVASVLGGYFGYFIGYELYDLVAHPLLSFYGYMDKFDTFKEYYNAYGAWIVIVGGITPFPYKIITITSGVVDLNLIVFGLASLFARAVRFYIIVWLLHKFGAPIRTFIEKNLSILSILFVIVLIGGFVSIKYI